MKMRIEKKCYENNISGLISCRAAFKEIAITSLSSHRGVYLKIQT